MMHYYYGNMFGWGGGVFMFIFGVFLIILLVWAIAGAGRRHYFYDRYYDQGNRGPDSPGRNTGLEVLNQRYAKGEITKEEYEQKKKDILS